MQDGRTLPISAVFVYGALRSGTTLFRLMLKSHERIGNPGEVDFLFDHIAPDPGHPTGWRYDLAALRDGRIFRSQALDLPEGRDGLDLLAAMLEQLAARAPGVLTLNIHRHVDRLLAISPDVRILHLLRDPRDVARSSIGMGWAGTLYHGVDHWIRTETAWDRVAGRIAPDRRLELTYEALFVDIEGGLRRVCAFLGVPYSDRMLDYHKTSTYGPPDAALAEQWRHRSTAREIALVEGKAAALMRARGYVPSGPGRIPGMPERLWLWLVDKAVVWRFGIRRYGAWLFLAEKLTRWFGLSRPQRVLRRRMQEIDRRHLK